MYSIFANFTKIQCVRINITCKFVMYFSAISTTYCLLCPDIHMINIIDDLNANSEILGLKYYGAFKASHLLNKFARF